MERGKVAAEEITLLQNKLATRSSKLLGYKVPNEIYDAMCLAA
jgi:hypothetical protein